MKAEKSKNKQQKTDRDEQGRFRKGAKKPPTSGRKAGTKNKYSNLREAVQEQCAPLLENLGTLLMQIDDPKDRADALSKFVPFFLPKYSSTTISADTERPMSEEERLMELDSTYTQKQIDISVKTIKVVDNDNAGKKIDISAKDLGLE